MTVLLAPRAPCGKEFVAANSAVRSHRAPLVKENGDWRGKVFEFLYELLSGLGLDKITSLLKALPTGDCPKQNAGQFLQQSIRQPVIFRAVKTLNEAQDEKSSSKRG